MTDRIARATKLLRDLSALGFHPTGLLLNRDVIAEIDQAYSKAGTQEEPPAPFTPRTFLGIPFKVQP